MNAMPVPATPAGSPAATSSVTDDGSAARALSPTARPMPGRLGVLAAQVKAEFLQLVRAPEYVIGVVGVPVILYSMFGLPTAGERLPGGTDVALMLLALVRGVRDRQPGDLHLRVDAARERGQGGCAGCGPRRCRCGPTSARRWSRRWRSPCSSGSARCSSGLRGPPGHPVADLLRLLGALMVGTVAFCTFGFAIAYWFTPRPPLRWGTHLLPLSFCSGLPAALAAARAVPDHRALLADLPLRLPHLGTGRPSPISPPSQGVGRGLGHPRGLGCRACAVFTVLTVIGYRRDLDRSRS